MRELFIYYRATQENASVLHAQVSRMQTELRVRHPGLQARLLRRPEAADGLHTWMETYSSPDGIDGALQAAIEHAALSLAPWIEGARHTERFDACA
ncbi:DUF4936 family protein [Piscinibacter sp. HJYY11]|uniref:DUF4936 family protein n=1 Tax=Piscinibacter sp. HJYY11 TaxID=2801333 RepID=UPI00191F145E|nr:DUF4936 family protein [Piscinibacter sp. HJYY11]MBL0726666.1 DUF4936 family protein [Piscinibacter sp. HJYY11]